MSPAPQKRSTILVAVGAGVFVVGSGLAALATHDSGGGSENKQAAVTTTIPPTGLATAAAAAPAPSFVIPDGKQAIAVSMPAVAGVNGYAKSGDYVNVYGALKTQGAARLILQKVEVLSVTAPPPGVEGNSTYVLAVNTTDAEAVVFLTKFQDTYLTLARNDQGTLTPKGFGDANAK